MKREAYNHYALRKMNIKEQSEQIKRSLVADILKCLNGEVPKETFINLAANLTNTPEIHTDDSLFQSFTLIDFFSQMLTNGNELLVSQPLVREGCTYMLDKLTGKPPLP